MLCLYTVRGRDERHRQQWQRVIAGVEKLQPLYTSRLGILKGQLHTLVRERRVGDECLKDHGAWILRSGASQWLFGWLCTTYDLGCPLLTIGTPPTCLEPF